MTSPPTPRVSVLMPCRDAESHLDASIASIVAQTEARWELLVLDDGSSDGTTARLAAWVERDPRIRYVVAAGNGIVAGLNRLAGEARAPILARMDADDLSYPHRLAAQLALLDTRLDIAACGTGVRYVPDHRAGAGYRRYENWLNALHEPDTIERDLLVECPIAHPTLMIRRPILEELGGYRDFEGPEDYDLLLRAVRAGHRLANVPEVLFDWRLGPDRLSESSPRYAPSAFRRLKIEHIRERHPAAAGRTNRGVVLWGAGKVGKAFLRQWIEDGMPRFEALIDLDPRKIGQEIHGSPVVHPDELAKRFAGSSEGPFTIVGVGSPGARGEIRGALAGMRRREIDDYLVVA